MKVYTQKETDNELILNEKGELIGINIRGYVIHTEDNKEYEFMHNHITVAIDKGIEVYEGLTYFRKLEMCDSKIICSTLPAFIFTTSDKDKFDSLDQIIKDILSFNRNKSINQ